MSQILMVYGTLQRRQRNHWRLLDSKFLGRASIRGHLYQFPPLEFSHFAPRPTLESRGPRRCIW